MKADPRHAAGQSRHRAPLRRTRNTTPSCTPPASPRGSQAATPTMRCRRPRRPTSTAASCPAIRWKKHVRTSSASSTTRRSPCATSTDGGEVFDTAPDRKALPPAALNPEVTEPAGSAGEQDCGPAFQSSQLCPPEPPTASSRMPRACQPTPSQASHSKRTTSAPTAKTSAYRLTRTTAASISTTSSSKRWSESISDLTRCSNKKARQMIGGLPFIRCLR